MAIFRVLKLSLLPQVFHLLYPTVPQITTSSHVRIHTNRAQNEKEKEESHHRSQFDIIFCEPESIRDIIEKCTESYKSGYTMLADNWVHYHTISDKVFDSWDFEFKHLDYNQSLTDRVGYITTPTGDTYRQHDIRTVY